MASGCQEKMFSLQMSKFSSSQACLLYCTYTHSWLSLEAENDSGQYSYVRVFQKFFCIYLITYSLNLLGVRPPSQSLQLPFTGLEPYVRLNTALLYFQSMVCKQSFHRL